MLATGPILFILCLLVVSFLYASVGHGGASGYLAVMALFGIAPSVMKSSALIMNIFVALISFYGYYRSGYFKWRLFVPFALASVPAAALGSGIAVDPVLFKKILGVVLLFPVLRLFGAFGSGSTDLRPVNLYLALVIGGCIGFFSGMLGIGGGILLSPVILLMRWGSMKETAAVSALFIFVNSISGFAVLLAKGVNIDHAVFFWLGAVIIGGSAGAYVGSRKLMNPALSRVLAFVLLIASIKLMTEPGKK